MQIFISTFTRKLIALDVDPFDTIEDLKDKIEMKEGYPSEAQRLFFNNIQLQDNKTLDFYKIGKNFTIILIPKLKGGGSSYKKEINIKFIFENTIINNSGNSIINESFHSDKNLNGLLKLCLLKEISSKLRYDDIIKLPELLLAIMQILKRGYVEDEVKSEEIKKVLIRIKGSNIINFARYVDNIIDPTQIKKLILLLKEKHRNYIVDISNRLIHYIEYMKQFEKDFEERKRESIFEFSIISIVIMEREDFFSFEKERQNCPNRVDKILYHGTQIEPIANILTGYFRKSVDKCCQ